MDTPDSKKSFGDWLVARYLGHGSFGHAYVVKRDGQRGEYVLKWLRAGSDASGFGRLRNEIWALQELKHPHIPSFVDSGTEEDLPYLVMTFARGISLRRRFNEQRLEGGTTSQITVLQILVNVLDALAHMHSKGICHRDVKDDNIIATDAARDVSLVDLGFCKGQNQPEHVATIWNAGAARYSPPQKLEHPSDAEPAHDVFAAGVVSYLLLTNQYPWDLTDTEDVSALKQRMLTRRPVPVSVINTLVARELNELIERLLTTDDARRPSAVVARDQAGDVLEQLRARFKAPSVTQGRVITFPHVVRDPIHGDIRMTDFEWKLLDTPQFQRLHRIKQLGFSRYIYPGAQHTRSSHAIGTLHIADRILRSIEDRGDTYFDAEERLMARAYALVHDVTHIAFGHTLEDELALYKRHDANNERFARLVLSSKSAIGNLLRSTDYGAAAIDLLTGGVGASKYAYIREMVSGPTGADVLDYIDRDSLFCGLDHKVDTAIYRRFGVSPVGVGGDSEAQRLVSQVFGRHGLRLDAEFALESVLMERFSLFMKVYTHPTKTAAGAMLGKAILDMRSGRGGFSEERLEAFGDSELLDFLAASKRKRAALLATQLINRVLFKPAFQSRALPSEDRSPAKFEAKLIQLQNRGLLDHKARAHEEEKIAKEAGISADDVIIYCSASVPGLQKVSQMIEEKPGAASIRDETHDVHLGAFQRHLALWSVYVFLAPGHDDDVLKKVRKASETLFSLKNEGAYDKRQGVLFGYQ